MARTPQQQQPPNPSVIDPDNVPETLCYGRFFIHWTGQLGTLTFTHDRPDVGPAFENDTVNVRGIVRARIVMPLENAVALRDLLNRVIKTEQSGTTTPEAGGSTRH